MDAAGCDTIDADAAVECRNLTHPARSSRAKKVFCMSLGLGSVSCRESVPPFSLFKTINPEHGVLRPF